MSVCGWGVVGAIVVVGRSLQWSHSLFLALRSLVARRSFFCLWVGWLGDRYNGGEFVPQAIASVPGDRFCLLRSF